MKKTHIIILVLIAASIAVLISFTGDLSTYDTVESATQKEGKYVHLIAKLDKTQPVEYDAVKNPNLTVFYAVDAKGERQKVVYTKEKIKDMERSEGLDLNGYMRDGYFECNRIQTKCPSKYKDDMKAAEKNLPSGTSNQ